MPPHLTIDDLFNRFSDHESISDTSSEHAIPEATNRYTSEFKSYLNTELTAYLYLPTNARFHTCFPGTRLPPTSPVLGLPVIPQDLFQKLHKSLTRKFRSHLALTFTDLPAMLPSFVPRAISRHINWLISHCQPERARPDQTPTRRNQRPARPAATRQAPDLQGSPEPARSPETAASILAAIAARADAFVPASDPEPVPVPTTEAEDDSTSSTPSPVEPSLAPEPFSDEPTAQESLYDHLPAPEDARQQLRDMFRRARASFEPVYFDRLPTERLLSTAEIPLPENNGYPFDRYLFSNPAQHGQRFMHSHCFTCYALDVLVHFNDSVFVTHGPIQFARPPTPVQRAPTPLPPQPQPQPLVSRLVIQLNTIPGYSRNLTFARAIAAIDVSLLPLPPRPEVELAPTRLARRARDFVPGLHACILGLPHQHQLVIWNTSPHNIPAGMECSLPPTVMTNIRNLYL
jgi:hypothetical protein